MTYYVYNNGGRYTGTVNAQLNPKATMREGHDVYFGYPNSTTVAPPLQEGFDAVWNGSAWTLVQIPVPETPEEPEPTQEEKDAAEVERLKAYLADTDWVDVKIDELYKKRLTETMLKYGGMTEAAWNDAIGYLAVLQNQYASVLDGRDAARAAINAITG